MFKLTFSAKRFFFDQQAVQDRLSKREARAMAKIGAFIRRDARQSIKRRKSVSSPDSPPSAHSPDPSLKTILFAYEPSKHTVVVGPVLLRGRGRKKSFFLENVAARKRDKQGRFQRSEDGVWIANIEVDDTSPALHEFGGTGRATIDDEPVTLRWEPRPFMGPALNRQSRNHKLIDAWRELL